MFRGSAWRALAFLCLSLAPGALFADGILTVTGTTTSTYLTIKDPNLGSGSVNAIIDPYKGNLNGAAVLLFCVDPDHYDKSGAYSVYVSSNSTNYNNTLQVLDGKSASAAASTYGELAWLSQQMLATKDSVTQQEIQAAIWSIAEGTPNITNLSATSQQTGDFTYYVPISDATTFNTGVQNYENAAAKNGLTSGFEVLTDAACTTANLNNCTNCGQEYIVLTPEPSSMLLFGTGLSGVAAMLRRRKMKS